MRVIGVAAQLRTTDLAESIRFYTEKLGFALDFQYQDFYAGIRAGDHVFHLKQVDEKDSSIDDVDTGDHFHLYLQVDNVSEAAEAFEGHGVPLARDVHDTAWSTREFVIKDDQGHTLYVGQNQSRKELRTTFGHPTPELPVKDVQRAQQHYRDALGFEIRWLYPGNEIGAVSRDDVAVIFRRRTPPFEPATHWVFAADIDGTFEELRSLGARIVEPLEKKPWGLRQFTVEDVDGNRFYFHCD